MRPAAASRWCGLAVAPARQVGDNLVCVKPGFLDMGGDVGAPQERAGKVGKALSGCFVAAWSFEPVREGSGLKGVKEKTSVLASS